MITGMLSFKDNINIIMHQPLVIFSSDNMRQENCLCTMC